MRKLLSACGAATLLLVGCDESTSPEPASNLTSTSAPVSTIVDLGVQGSASDVSPSGVIAGNAENGEGSTRPFVWSDGQLTYLDAPGSDSRALAINPSGKVAGYRGSPAHAVVWDGEGVVDLGTLPGGEFTNAAGINAAGQVVGHGNHPSGWERAFVWQRGVMTELAFLPRYPTANALDINGVGQIVGVMSDGDVARAIIWDKGVPQEIGPLPGHAHAAAQAINSAGQVVGWSGFPNGPEHAFLWEKGVMTDLGTLPGGTASMAMDINSAGHIVGTSDTENGEVHAFLWKDGVMTDLGTLAGATSSSAAAINDQGDVVGSSGGRAVLWRIR
jgi:probable HAF family extracellular repeat protein